MEKLTQMLRWNYWWPIEKVAEKLKHEVTMCKNIAEKSQQQTSTKETVMCSDLSASLFEEPAFWKWIMMVNEMRIFTVTQK
jgi:hypothetical protein